MRTQLLAEIDYFFVLCSGVEVEGSTTGSVSQLVRPSSGQSVGISGLSGLSQLINQSVSPSAS